MKNEAVNQGRRHRTKQWGFCSGDEGMFQDDNWAAGPERNSSPLEQEDSGLLEGCSRQEGEDGII